MQTNFILPPYFEFFGFEQLLEIEERRVVDTEITECFAKTWKIFAAPNSERAPIRRRFRGCLYLACGRDIRGTSRRDLKLGQNRRAGGERCGILSQQRRISCRLASNRLTSYLVP
jgi:hypothetical protein